MPTNMEIWKNRVIEQVAHIADEAFQRTVWFGGGGGKWVDSPEETICKFDDLFVPDILARPDHGLKENQAAELARLSRLMDDLVDNTPDSIRPEDLIDDPRWQKIRAQAKVTLEVLQER